MKLKFFILMMIGLLFQCGHLYAQDGREKISIKARHYLVHGDTVVYFQNDTVIYLPEGTAYRIKKDASTFLAYPFHGYLLKLFYRPESETTPVSDTVLIIKSESPYAAYENRIIRHIIIYPIGVTDPPLPLFVVKKKNAVDSAAEAIHINTREQIIRKSLFFHEGDSVHPYVLSDNERYLRSFPFFQDALIMIDTNYTSVDSVDIIVATKDVWSIGITGGAVIIDPHTSRIHGEIFDGNFLGYGQRLGLNFSYDTKQDPRLGEGITYTKYNFLGTLADLNAGCSTVNGGPHLGGENESSVYLQLNRAFILPATRYSGGITASLNRSNNVFQKPAEEFLQYSYLYTDVWSAYTLIHYKTRSIELQSRNGQYLSGRFFRQSFINKPKQEPALLLPAYNDQWFVIGGLNFFRERFYKTRFISEYGKTEDIPYGYFFSVYAGYQYASFRYRFYSGTEYEKDIVYANGSFMQIRAMAGTFFHSGKAEDIILRYNGYWYSRLFFPYGTKMRQMFSSSYVIALHPFLSGPVGVNGSTGINGFTSDVPSGLQRLVVHSETSCWAPFLVYGFRFVLFVSEEIAAIGPNNGFLLNSKLYAGFGSGVRIKNENLIFRSLEVKFFYYPAVPSGNSNFLVTVSTSVRLNFSSSLIHAPSFITME
ncbi:MAG TPA: hypothetical protein VL651_09580 [Bacteroidia bacterium]|jgi:hypothetical protein|nr:hypothetical protein [Bacteroidia bacterium]